MPSRREVRMIIVVVVRRVMPVGQTICCWDVFIDSVAGERQLVVFGLPACVGKRTRDLGMGSGQDGLGEI
ncbi:hypothetical protein V6N13_061128 [Hibiscus sabdariffa]